MHDYFMDVSAITCFVLFRHSVREVPESSVQPVRQHHSCHCWSWTRACSHLFWAGRHLLPQTGPLMYMCRMFMLGKLHYEVTTFEKWGLQPCSEFCWFTSDLTLHSTQRKAVFESIGWCKNKPVHTIGQKFWDFFGDEYATFIIQTIFLSWPVIISTEMMYMCL